MRRLRAGWSHLICWAVDRHEIHRHLAQAREQARAAHRVMIEQDAALTLTNELLLALDERIAELERGDTG